MTGKNEELRIDACKKYNELLVAGYRLSHAILAYILANPDEFDLPFESEYDPGNGLKEFMETEKFGNYEQTSIKLNYILSVLSAIILRSSGEAFQRYLDRIFSQYELEMDIYTVALNGSSFEDRLRGEFLKRFEHKKKGRPKKNASKKESTKKPIRSLPTHISNFVLMRKPRGRNPRSAKSILAAYNYYFKNILESEKESK